MKTETKNLELEVKQSYDFYFKSNEKTMFGMNTFSTYKKDNLLSKKSFEEIINLMNLFQKRTTPGNSYYKLEKVLQKGKNIIYKFKVIPGFDSNAVKRNHPASFDYYKIVPRD